LAVERSLALNALSALRREHGVTLEILVELVEQVNQSSSGRRARRATTLQKCLRVARSWRARSWRSASFRGLAVP
jgi:hypothetical protein